MCAKARLALFRWVLRELLLGSWGVGTCMLVGLVGSCCVLVHTDIPGNDLQGED